MVKRGNEGTSSEEPLGGFLPLAKQLDAMKREADAVIERRGAGPGDAGARYALGAVEIHFAMRDELGPANAQLFADRQKKLEQLADAVGLADAPPDPPRRMDDFVRESRDLVARLRERGLLVTEEPVMSRRILWQPDVAGWQLTIEDPSRKVEEDVPYAGTPHGPPKAATPAKIHPRVHLWLFPQVRMRASQSMVRREQPGEPRFAGAGLVAFRLQAAQSRDEDPGGKIEGVLDEITSGAAPRELPEIARELRGGTAVLERGIVRVSGRDEPPAEDPESAVPDVRVILWSVRHGANVEHTLFPRWQ